MRPRRSLSVPTMIVALLMLFSVKQCLVGGTRFVKSVGSLKDLSTIASGLARPKDHHAHHVCKVLLQALLPPHRDKVESNGCCLELQPWSFTAGTNLRRV